jgi:hypothetical protein
MCSSFCSIFYPLTQFLFVMTAPALVFFVRIQNEPGLISGLVVRDPEYGPPHLAERTSSAWI